MSGAGRWIGVWLATAAAATATLVAAGPAAAGVGSASFTSEHTQVSLLTYYSGRTADVKVTDAGPNAWRISDANGTGWDSLDGCSRIGTMTVTCGGANAKPASLLLFFLSDGNDAFELAATPPSALGRHITVKGGTGEDRFTGGAASNDSWFGGAGFDTMSYVSRPAGVVVNFLPGASDTAGHPATGAQNSVERDDLEQIDRVIGTSFADGVKSDADGFPYVQFGRAGGDHLYGSPIAHNTLDGGAGADELFGDGGMSTSGAGDADMLIGRESPNDVGGAQRDYLYCGAGNDTAVMDLMDTSLGCENRQVAAIDEGAILSVGPGPLRVRHGGVPVSLRCPRASKTPCHGTLTLATASGRPLGGVRYGLRRGQSAARSVRLGAAAVRSLAGRGRLDVDVTALGRDSKGRPKTTVARRVLHVGG